MNEEQNPPESGAQQQAAPAPEVSPSQKAQPSLLDTMTGRGGQEAPPQRKEKLAPAAIPARRMNAARFFSILAWVIALATVGYAAYLWQTLPVAAAQVVVTATPRPTLTPRPSDEAPPEVYLPVLPEPDLTDAVRRFAEAHTIIPTRPRAETILYTVSSGDAIFSIADQFNVKPETILWANYDLLNDNPDFLEVGMELNVPPVDGVYYQWKEGDTLESIAGEFEAEVDDILEFTGNGFDLSNPEAVAGQFVMIPGGEREFRQWLIPTINRGNAGVSSLALGPGACTGSYSGAYGSGAFIWPTGNHTLSGNDFWSGHLAIDIGEVEGNPIYASDAGVVVFTGWANGGYGYTVVVDHGNGYQTLYAHMSAVYLSCGASVGAGSVLGGAGSTGNSTGTHLHFEVRLNGGFINPWYVLPPP